MQRAVLSLVLLLALAFTGCKSSRVFHQPLADVRQTIQEMQADMLAEIAPECFRVGVRTNDIAKVSYVLHVQDVFRSGPFPYLTVEAQSWDDDKTKVTITRVAVNGNASLGVARRRDLERHRLEVLAAKLENAR